MSNTTPSNAPVSNSTNHTASQSKQAQSSICDIYDKQPVKFAIIGGGLTGLLSATLLEKMFAQANVPLKIDIFEKSRSVGRLATRYQYPNMDDDVTKPTQQWQFDFGVPFFTAKTAKFQNFLHPFIQRNVIEIWHANVLDLNQQDIDASVNVASTKPNARWTDAKPRFVASPKMNSFGRLLATQLQHSTIHFSTRVAPLSNPTTSQPTPTSSQLAMSLPKTQLMSETGASLGVFDWVICTAPKEQALDLLAHTNFAHLADIQQRQSMQACYSLMLGWLSADLPKSVANLAWDVLSLDESLTPVQASGKQPIGKIFVEHQKPSRTDILPSLTVHSSNAWAQAHVDDDMQVVTKQMLVATAQLVGFDANRVTHVDCHRWRYASTSTVSSDEQPANPAFYVDEQKRWAVVGDWCTQARVESCFSNAHQLVTWVANTLLR